MTETEEENKEALLRVYASAKRLRTVAAGLVIAGTVLVIFATATALSYHIYYMRRNAWQFSAGIGKLYLCLSMGVFLVTGVLIGGIVAYAVYRRSAILRGTHSTSAGHDTESSLLQGNETLAASSEHDENCFSCMPDTLEDQIPGRSLSILERSSKLFHKGHEQKSLAREDVDLCSAESDKNVVPRFHSDGSVKSGANRQVFSEFYDYSIFALSSSDISEEQLSEIRARKNRVVVPTSMKKGRARAFKLGTDSQFKVVTYSPRSGYPPLMQDLHIIRKVKFPWRWKVNNSADVMVEMHSPVDNINPADFVCSNIYYNVDVPITYCNLIKLMFSYQAISSGDTEKLFIRYLRFYYGILWELAERVSDGIQTGEHLTEFTVRQSLYYDPIGAQFAADIVQNYTNFSVFVREYEKTEETRELFGFLESVRKCMPKSFFMPVDTRTGYLYETMCAVYGLSCSKDSNLFCQDLSPTVSQMFHYIFFFQKDLRKALIVNTIVDETFREGEDSSFLCSKIYYLKNSIRVMLRVYDAESKPDTFAEKIREIYSASEENKHILAAMALSESGQRIGLTRVMDSISDYGVRKDDFMRLKKLAANPSFSFELGSGAKWSINKGVFYSVPYVVVDTIRDLESEERANVIFDPDDGVRETSYANLLKLYRDMMQLVDFYFLECMWNNKNSIIGQGFYQNTLTSKAEGVYALPLMEEFVAIRKVIADGCEQQETEPQEIGRNTISECESETNSAICGSGESMGSSSIDENCSVGASDKGIQPTRASSETGVLCVSFSKPSSEPSRRVSVVSIKNISPEVCEQIT